MGKEIELKIPLTEQQYDDLHKKYFSDSKMIYKHDEYYSRYKTITERDENGEPSVIRIRTESVENESSKSFFTIKKRSIVNGIEINKEDETFIEDAQILRDFFNVSGYFCWFNKEKKAYSCYKKSKINPVIEFHMELVIVNEMKYLEVEVTDEKKLDDFLIQDDLKNLILEIGLDYQKREKRTWYELINEEENAK